MGTRSKLDIWGKVLQWQNHNQKRIKMPILLSFIMLELYHTTSLDGWKKTKILLMILLLMFSRDLPVHFNLFFGLTTQVNLLLQMKEKRRKRRAAEKRYPPYILFNWLS